MTARDLVTAPAASIALFETVASPEQATAHFAGRLAVEADVSDVAAALDAGGTGFVLVDTRGAEAWAQGRVPGAVHLPRRRIAEEGTALVGVGTAVVVYCWGPGCNGATRAALEFARLGHPVKEMIGGFEYWVREGFAVETDRGLVLRDADPLTNVTAMGLGGKPAASLGATGISCDC